MVGTEMGILGGGAAQERVWGGRIEARALDAPGELGQSTPGPAGGATLPAPTAAGRRGQDTR